MIARVPPFAPNSSVTESLDYGLARFGPVHLFWNPEVLARLTRWLADRGYDLVTVDAAGWTDEAVMHRALAGALEFPDYYGHNLPALDECFDDIGTFYNSPVTTPSALGFALVIEHIDAFARADPWLAHRLLESFARAAHQGALIGHRMLCLVQSSDPRLQFSRVGAWEVRWNPDEWLNARRGL